MHASSKSDLQFGQSAWVTHPKQTEWEVQLISGWANEFQAGFRTMKRPVGHSSVGRSCLSDALYLLGSEPISHSFGTKSNRGSDPERGESTGPCIFVNCDCRNRKDGGQLFGSQGTPKLFDAIGQGERLNFGHARRPSHWTLKAGLSFSVVTFAFVVGGAGKQVYALAVMPWAAMVRPAAILFSELRTVGSG